MINAEVKDNNILITPKGEVNAQVGIKMKEIIKEKLGENKGIASVIIFFNDVVYINSSGIRELIDILKYLKSENKNLYLIGMSKEIREMFSFTNLDSVFNIFNNLEDIFK
ncbi:MAG: STAS domain-containing protein [Deferribacterota bacterium]|nr:STAS domain-containing protein [Deferribacterota bacterium]